MPNDAERAAALLLEARRGGAPLEDLPVALRPTGIGQAYAIQDAVIRQTGRIGGWKVGPRRGDADPSCAPIGAELIHASPARFAAMPGAEIEVEIAVTLGRDLPPRETPYAADDLREAIATLHPAIELLGSRFRDRKAASALSVVADSQSNAAVVLDPGRADWQGLALESVGMRLRLDGAEVATVAGGADTANVLSALAWLADHAAARTGGLRRGDVVITGARLGPWPRGAATDVEAEVAGLGTVGIAFD
ncbi:fumarylacetoacetate hydrolase family protein [Roseomonas sp. OT10]|uniref:2-keto-4-pentenoate hydratase n=1 Tax=Roseomonas cutis TaxID=2897332 RepID=UPI001E51B743|nr:fumarylacetoacetate hydrolase family protein [Roseomonas sp. OT10]UFN48266.1 fumarylacetoacetate hydrolase family protein [Roseomonas sp. OT10]